MLYWLTGLSDGGDFFNLFRYITFRAGGAFLTALVFGFMFGRPLINVLRRKQGKGQPIRSDGPEGHFVKAGTPTMGGLLILSALFFSTLLWARLDIGFNLGKIKRATFRTTCGTSNRWDPRLVYSHGCVDT